MLHRSPKQIFSQICTIILHVHLWKSHRNGWKREGSLKETGEATGQTFCLLFKADIIFDGQLSQLETVWGFLFKRVALSGGERRV